MFSTANVSIRLTSFGDVVLDQLIAAIENKKSLSMVLLQAIPPNVSTPITVTFAEHMTAGYQVTGLLLVPPVDNVTPYTFSSNLIPPDFNFHPTNPVFMPFNHVGVPVYLYHTAAKSLVFKFFWI
jgi:hypothetical protein